MNNAQRAAEFANKALADWEAGMNSTSPELIYGYARQSAEKYLKAFLAFHGQTLQECEGIVDLTQRCAEIDSSFHAHLEHAETLLKFYLETRYSPLPVDKELEQGWTAMHTIFEAVKGKLPEAVIPDITGVKPKQT